MKFGKLAPLNDYRTLRLSSYLEADLPAPPPSYSTLERVYKNLNVSDPKELFPMDGNDRLGDCTIAAVGHAATLFNGMIGVKHIYTEEEIVNTYLKLTGGKDTGLRELDVLNYWRKNVTCGSKILGYAKIRTSNHDHIKQAIKIFGGVYIGFQVTENCLEQFENNQTWTTGKLLNEGHAVFATDYDENGVTVLTWGNVQKGTWQWWDQCVDEAYAIIPRVALLDSFQYINFYQLQKDLKAIAA